MLVYRYRYCDRYCYCLICGLSRFVGILGLDVELTMWAGTAGASPYLALLIWNYEYEFEYDLAIHEYVHKHK